MPFLTHVRHWLKRSPSSGWAEMAIFFGFALASDRIWGSGDAWTGLSPHPFWLIVLLMAAQYGTKEALSAALISSALLLALGGRPPGLDEDLYTHAWNLAARPLAWLGAAVVFGEIRRRHENRLEQLKDERNRLERQQRETREAFERSQRLRQQLEAIVASNLSSAVRLFRAARAMDSLDPMTVLHGVSPLVQAMLGAEKFSVYALRGKILSCVFDEGWTPEDAFRREIAASDPLAQRILARGPVVCAARREDELILEGQGLLAGALYDPETHGVLGMLKVEKIGFGALSASGIENFRAACDWIGAAYAKALRHDVARANGILAGDSPLLSETFYQRESEFLARLAKRVNFDLSVIHLRVHQNRSLTEQPDRHDADEAIDKTVRACLRGTDLAFKDSREGGYRLLLSDTPVEGAAIVSQKIRAALEAEFLKCSEGNADHQLVISLMALHKKTELQEEMLGPILETVS